MFAVKRLTIMLVSLLHIACAADQSGPSGAVLYLKRTGAVTGQITTSLEPVRRATVTLSNSGGEWVDSTTTDDDGYYEFSSSYDAGFSATVEARAEGPRLNVWVHDHELDTTVYAVALSESGVTEITDPYLAGAFNVLDLNVQIADALNGLVDESVPEPLEVRWSEANKPYCGSCFFDEERLLDLAGKAGEEDAHDDSVVLHEFGHYIEATWGVYDNPTGLHNMEYVIPTLAWSEGFANWLQGALRNSAIYIDLRPNNLVYSLDLESPPVAVYGTRSGRVDSDYSEGLVHGLLWDLSDAGVDDDDGADHSFEEVMEAALAITQGPDLGHPGADLVDFLNHWRCAHPNEDDESALAALLNTFQFPYDVSEPPTCPR
jgi:hypothetical protein